MLSPGNRMTSSRLFARAVRRGRRAGTRTMVVSVVDRDSGENGPVEVGFVVGKSVGPAVTRNLVKRRLRHLVRERVDQLPGSSVVVRALPPAAAASYGDLARDLDVALAKAAAQGSARRADAEPAARRRR